MPTPTIAVTCAASDQGGESVAGGIYTAKLDQTEIYDGFVVPEQVTATADADGLVILNLWPNALGVNGSSYRITARNPDTGKKFFDASVVVPNNPCNLYQIVQNAPFPNVDSAQQALIDVQALVTIANQDVATTNADAQQAAAYRTAARDSAANALTSVQIVVAAQLDITSNWSDKLATAAEQAGIATTGGNTATTQAGISTAQAGLAATAKTAAELAAANANNSAVAADASKVAAAGSATAAAGSASTVSTSAASALASKDAAALSATAASTSATNAGNSATAAAGSNAAAGTSAANALVSKNAASDKAAEASGHANAASGQAGLATNAAATTQTLRDSIIATQGSIGYLPPVAYAAGLAITLPAQTVSYLGQAYAPLLSALPLTASGTFEAAKFRLIQGVAGVDLAAPGGAGMVGFDASLNYIAGSLGAHFQGEVNIRDFPWNCKCDGVTDDAAGFWAAVTFAKTRGYKIIHPGGVCRLTYGYTQSTAYTNIFIHGNGRINEQSGSSVSSMFLLDSTDAASKFLEVATNTTLHFSGLIFKCAQAVIDRPFFKFSASLHAEFFQGCSFVNVERPIVWAAGSYFQNASYRDVQFANSGTFHSESPNTNGELVGTLLALDNVNHEGACPTTNTEKIVCNLQGVRKILGSNFLLEGAVPSSGWTILRLNNTFDGRYTRDPMAEISNFWSEWTGAYQPAYAVDQIGGSVTISGHLGLKLSDNKYKVSSLGKVNLNRSGFIYTADEASLFFELEDGQCLVSFNDCSFRKFDTSKTGFIHNNTQIGDIVNGIGQVVLSNTAAHSIYKWSGGNVPADGCTLSLFSGSSVVSTDATFGRKFVIAPAAGSVDGQLRVPSVIGNIAKGVQIVVCLKAKLPTFATGLWRFDVVVDNAAVALKYFDSTQSGQVVDVVIPWVLTANPTINIGIGFSNGTTSGVSTLVEIYSMAIFHGNAIARSLITLYPTNIQTRGTAAPTTGTWAQGDRVINSVPAVGSPKAWTCAAAGSPGTWVSEGNL